MRRRITIEIETQECAVEEITQNIEAFALKQIAANQMTGFELRREDLPEKISRELQVPSFLVNRPFQDGMPSDCVRSDCKNRLYRKEAVVR